MKNCKSELLIISVVIYENLTILLANMHIDSGYLVVVTKDWKWRGTCAIPIYQVLPCLVIIHESVPCEHTPRDLSLL